MTSTLTDFPFAPVKQIHQCLHAFHVPAQDRTTFVESYHYCSHARDGMHQCVIYDSKEPDARLLGVEYIITEERFRALPSEEKPYWHSHKWEVGSGQLVALGMTGATGVLAQAASVASSSGGLPDKLEEAPMKHLYKTYGKAIHTWHPPTSDIPIGPPQVMMSTVQPSLCAPPPGLEEAIAARDKRFGVDTSAKRAAREKYLDQDFQPDDKSDDWLKSGKAKVFTHETVPCKRPDDDGNQEES